MSDVEFLVTRLQDAVMVRSSALRMARAIGMDTQRAAEAAIVVSELTTNAVKHGGGGVVRLWTDGEALFVEARDRGDGHAVVAQRLGRAPPLVPERPLDPADLQRGLNAGLDAVARFSDGVSAEEGPSGLVVRAVCRRGRAR